jgi:hypothetical protein
MALLTRVHRRAAAVLAALSLTAAAPRAQQRAPTAEDEIKAAFLLNFARFVEWPPSSPGTPLRICTVGDARFDGAVAHTIAGEASDGHPLQLDTPASPDAARNCGILFVGRQEDGHADRWLAAVRDRPVLVVAESKAAADAGAAITFVVEDNRVKFDVNDQAAARAGLKISSKLLRVARHVTPRSVS